MVAASRSCGIVGRVDPGRLRRLGAIAGVAFVATMVIASAITGSPPTSEDSDAVWQRFFVERHHQLLTQAWLVGLASPLLLWFGVTVRQVLREEVDGSGYLPDLFLIGVSVTATLLIAVMGMQVAFVRIAARLEPATLRAVGLDFGAAVVAFIGFVVAMVGLAFAGSVLSSRVLPAWTAWLAIAAVATNLVGTVGVFVQTGPFSIEGGFTVFVPPLVTMIWYLGTAAAVLRSTPSQPD